MIIEFCGVPGAGKSSVASELVSRLRGHGLVAALSLEEVSPRVPRWRRLCRKARRAGTEMVTHPRASVDVVRAVLRSRQRTTRDVSARSLNWLVLRSALRRARSTDGVHVIDQGLVQELCSLRFGSAAAVDVGIADPGSARLAPDLVVMIECEVSQADRRLVARPGRQSRVEGDSGEQLLAIERQRSLIEEVLTAWQERHACDVPTAFRRMTNDEGPIDVDELVQVVRELCPTASEFDRPTVMDMTEKCAPEQRTNRKGVRHAVHAQRI